MNSEEIQLELAKKDLRFAELREQHVQLQIEHEKLCMKLTQANHDAYVASLKQEAIEIEIFRKESNERDIEHYKREELHWRVVEEILKGRLSK